ncbi:MAG TPA: class I SAM-dependent methyltransferase [Solirubrobacteraceae bacterium]|nr:class I SAM-dependent methyltransferase [Solirubrobacteraceae bacterium]
MVAAAWEAVAGAAGVGQGTSLLDLGCGDGAFCAFAARRGANVHGLDVEPDAIAQALEAVPGADLRLGLMENLPWEDASFDVVTAFNALQYALDVDMALTEAARVARPDGRIAICKWGRPEENEFFAFLTAIGANGVRGDDLPATDPVDEAIRAARLEVLATDHVAAPIEMADRVSLSESLSRAGIDAAPSATSVTAAALPYRRADGTYRFENRLRYWILRGRR